MCGGGSPPPPQTPAAAPAPPAPGPVAPEVNEKTASQRNTATSTRGGTRSLRIDLASNTLTGKSGTNVTS